MKRIVLVAATIVATIPLAACTPFGASCWDPEDTFVSRAETDDADVAWVCVADGHVTGVA